MRISLCAAIPARMRPSCPAFAAGAALQSRLGTDRYFAGCFRSMTRLAACGACLTACPTQLGAKEAPVPARCWCQLLYRLRKPRHGERLVGEARRARTPCGSIVRCALDFPLRPPHRQWIPSHPRRVPPLAVGRGSGQTVPMAASDPSEGQPERTDSALARTVILGDAHLSRTACRGACSARAALGKLGRLHRSICQPAPWVDQSSWQSEQGPFRTRVRRVRHDPGVDAGGAGFGAGCLPQPVW